MRRTLHLALCVDGGNSRLDTLLRETTCVTRRRIDRGRSGRSGEGAVARTSNFLTKRSGIG